MLILGMVMFLTRLILHDCVVVLFCHPFKFISCSLIYGYYYVHYVSSKVKELFSSFPRSLTVGSILRLHISDIL